MCLEMRLFMHDPARPLKRACYSMKGLWNETYNIFNKCSKGKYCGWHDAWEFETTS